MLSLVAAMLLQTTTTECRREFDAVRCQSGPSLGDSIARIRRNQNAKEDAERMQMVTGRVMAAIRAGRCNEARDVALLYDQIDLAAKAMLVCSGTAPVENKPVVIHVEE